MQFLLIFCLLEIGAFGAAPQNLTPGEVVRVNVRVTEPGDLHSSENFLLLGSFRESLIPDGNGGLYAVFTIPSFNREPSPPWHVDLTDRAYNTARFSSFRHFVAPVMAPMTVDRLAPQISNVLWERQGNALQIHFNLSDDAPSFASAQVVSYLPHTQTELRKYPSRRALCERGTPSWHCSVQLVLPARLPGRPQIVIQAVDTAGNRNVASASDGRPLDLVWEGRAATDADTTPIQLSLNGVVQLGARVRVAFSYRGGDGMREFAVNGRLQVRTERRTLIQSFPIAGIGKVCEGMDCAVDVTLPERLASREFELILNATGENETTDFLAIESSRINLNRVLIDTVPPRLTSVQFEPAARADLESFQSRRRVEPGIANQ